MSNASIIQRMREACDQYEAGALSPMVLGEQLVALAGALEGRPRDVLELARAAEQELVIAENHLNDGERERADEIAQQAIARLRVWLDELDPW
jgi:hypothetical protein